MAEQLDEVTRTEKPKDVTDTDKSSASFKVYSGDKIPVSKSYGSLWKSRRDEARTLLEKRGTLSARTTAIRYFNNDQQSHRTEGDPDRPHNMGTASVLGDRFSETENIVFANTVALSRLLYVRNPDVAVSPIDPMDEQAAFVGTNVQRLVNALLQKRTGVGLNLKATAKRAIINAALTNESSVALDYIFRTPADEKAMADLQAISDELGKPGTSLTRVQELEGQLKALEETVSFLRPPGPCLRFIDSRDLFKEYDPYGKPRWMMYRQYEQTAWIQAKFGQSGPLGKNHSIYKPTHLLKPVAQGGGEDIDSLNNYVASFSLFNADEDLEWTQYGFHSEHAFRNSQYTLVWYVWDMTTQRQMMYSDRDWSWPIWVRNDPYKLEEFFPIYTLSFYEDPEGHSSKGEVAYYLDQQDGINEIASERRRVRLWARSKLAYDSNSGIKPEQIEKFLAGDHNAIGITLQEGKKIGDVLDAVLPPSAQIPGLLDSSELYQAIDRIASVNEVSRGGEFKTNTTNEAIQRYDEMSAVNLEDKIDAVEEWIGAIGWGLAQMCLMYMPQEQVAGLIGPRNAAGWANMQPQEIRGLFAAQVVGGSTQKPTSRQKKQEAINIGQVLGQFASASPAVILVALKVMERAFDEVVVSKEDWQMISSAIQQQLLGPPTQPGQEEASTPPENVTPISGAAG